MKKTRTPISLLLCTLLAMLMLLILLPLGTVSFAAEDETPEGTVVTVVETGDCGAEGSDVRYTLYSDGTMVIEGEGAIKAHAFEGKAIPRTTDIIIENGITAVGEYAFNDYAWFGSGLSDDCPSVVLADSVKTIGKDAFSGCWFRSFDFGGVERIERNAFYLTTIAEVVLPDTLKYIGMQNFQACMMQNTTVVFGKNLEFIDNFVFQHSTIEKAIFLNGNTELDATSGESFLPHDPSKIPVFYSYAGGSVEAYANQYGHPFVDLATYHEYDDGVVTKEPTYTEDGIKTFTCTLCGDTYTETVPAIGVVKTGQIGPDVYYKLYENGHADIYGTGETYASFYEIHHTTFFGFDLPVEITSLEVQPGVTGLMSEFGFSHLLKLQSVKLPASLTTIKPAMFHFCLSLESIDIDPENPAYTTVDGVLYNKPVTELVHYPLGKKDKTYTIPAGVKRIEERAFEAVRNLEEINFPDSVETIGFGAFMGAPDLNTVHLGNSVETIDDYAFYRVEIPVITIPGSVKQIGDWAFGYRLEFTDVYYPCPKEAWDKIEFGSDNEPLLNATLHFGEHAWDGGEITAPATCGKDGVKTFTCQNCGDTYTETIPATGEHSYTGVVTAKATCEADGVETFTCAVCGDSYTAPVAATGHDWSEWIVTRNPSENREGEAYRYCKNGCNQIETKTIDKLPETHEQSGNPIQRILDWVKSFFDSIGDLFRNLFRF